MNVGLSTFPTTCSMSATALAQAAEQRGFESIFVVEHTHVPASRRTPYPLGGELPSIYWQAYEPFTWLAQAAAVTDSLRIGTGVCLVAQHHPLALAKRVASLDAISGGRFLFGIGAGWLAEEMENHGVAFADRWKIVREHVLAMKACWTEQDAEFHGEFVDFDPVWVEPKPVSQPHPPVLMGATSKWAMERIAEYADGWYPVHGAEFDQRLGELRAACERRGRDFDALDITLLTVPDGPEQLEELAAKGVNRIVLQVPTAAAGACEATLDGYADILRWAGEVG